MHTLTKVTTLFSLSCVLACASTPTLADHFVMLNNNSSMTLHEVYIGDFQSWDDLLKGRPDELAGIALSPGESREIQPFYAECEASMIVTTEFDTVLVPGIDICVDEIILTDDDVALDY